MAGHNVADWLCIQSISYSLCCLGGDEVNPPFFLVSIEFLIYKFIQYLSDGQFAIKELELRNRAHIIEIVECT